MKLKDLPDDESAVLLALATLDRKFARRASSWPLVRIVHASQLDRNGASVALKKLESRRLAKPHRSTGSFEDEWLVTGDGIRLADGEDLSVPGSPGAMISVQGNVGQVVGTNYGTMSVQVDSELALALFEALTKAAEASQDRAAAQSLGAMREALATPGRPLSLLEKAKRFVQDANLIGSLAANPIVTKILVPFAASLMSGPPGTPPTGSRLP